jgi:hypothetical protein
MAQSIRIIKRVGPIIEAEVVDDLPDRDTWETTWSADEINDGDFGTARTRQPLKLEETTPVIEPVTSSVDMDVFETVCAERDEAEKKLRILRSGLNAEVERLQKVIWDYDHLPHPVGGSVYGRIGAEEEIPRLQQLLGISS